jgi:hypothetical protein
LSGITTELPDLLVELTFVGGTLQFRKLVVCCSTFLAADELVDVAPQGAVFFAEFLHVLLLVFRSCKCCCEL